MRSILMTWAFAAPAAYKFFTISRESFVDGCGGGSGLYSDPIADPIYQEPVPIQVQSKTICETWPLMPGCEPDAAGFGMCDPSTSPDDCGMDPAWSFTLGIRAPGQTFKQCMVAHANNYSIGGAAELAVNTATGTNTSFSSNPAVSAFTGNTITGLISAVAGGNAGDAASGAASAAPGLVNSGMASTLTYGRRTSQLISLNLAGRGGLPKALSSATSGLKSLLSGAEKSSEVRNGPTKGCGRCWLGRSRSHWVRDSEVVDAKRERRGPQRVCERGSNSPCSYLARVGVWRNGNSVFPECSLADLGLGSVTSRRGRFLRDHGPLGQGFSRPASARDVE